MTMAITIERTADNLTIQIKVQVLDLWRETQSIPDCDRIGTWDLTWSSTIILKLITILFRENV